MSKQHLLEEAKRHHALARAILETPGQITTDDAARAEWHMSESERYKTQAQVLANGQPISGEGSIGIDDIHSGKGVMPEHVKMLSHKQKVADHLRTKVDPEAAYGWLGMNFKNAVSPQRPDVMEKWSRAAGISAKDMGTGGSGGLLIPTPIAGFLIDLLRANTVTSKMGATTVPMTADM